MSDRLSSYVRGCSLYRNRRGYLDTAIHRRPRARSRNHALVPNYEWKRRELLANQRHYRDSVSALIRCSQMPMRRCGRRLFRHASVISTINDINAGQPTTAKVSRHHFDRRSTSAIFYRHRPCPGRTVQWFQQTACSESNGQDDCQWVAQQTSYMNWP